MIVLGFIVGIIVLLVLVTLHEYAHFVIAKLAKAYVYEFSVGLGPKLFSWKRKETVYSIRAFPFGGYVYIASQYVDAPKGREDEEVSPEQYMENINKFKRLGFIASGAIFNLMIAMFIFSMVFCSLGYQPHVMNYWGAEYTKDNSAYLSMNKTGNPEVTSKNVITNYWLGYDITAIQSVSRDYYTDPQHNDPKDMQGVIHRQLGDANSIPTYTTTVYDFIKYLKEVPRNDEHSKGGYLLVSFIIVDSNKKITVNSNSPYPDTDDFQGEIVPLDYNDDGSAYVGIAAPNREFNNIVVAYFYGWKEAFVNSGTILKSFGHLITGHLKDLSGPVGIAKSIGGVINTGAADFFSYVAMLSANLFVINLIPIPPLDGYKFWELSFEIILRKELSKKKKLIINASGAVLFLLLFIGITIKDIIT